MSELAKEIGVSRTWLNEQFPAKYGVTPSEFLKRAQVARAKRLLETTRLKPEQIARRGGFGTRRSFNRVFLRLTGVTPIAYRRMHSRRSD